MQLSVIPARIIAKMMQMQANRLFIQMRCFNFCFAMSYIVQQITILIIAAYKGRRNDERLIYYQPLVHTFFKYVVQD